LIKIITGVVFNFYLHNFFISKPFTCCKTLSETYSHHATACRAFRNMIMTCMELYINSEIGVIFKYTIYLFDN